MKEWREYLCEGFEMSDEVLVDPDARIENCPDGEDPVMVYRSTPTDRPVISIISRARVRIGNSGVSHERDYKIELTSLIDDNFRLLSKGTFKKEAVLEVVSLLVGLEKAAALRVWKSKKL